MKEKLVKRYIADCGRGYWKKQSAIKHDNNCKCWSNPKYKTCITCKYGFRIIDSNGMEHEPQNLETWKQWDCRNPLFNYDIDFTPAHEKASDLCINCPKWVSKNEKPTN